VPRRTGFHVLRRGVLYKEQDWGVTSGLNVGHGVLATCWT
jgi:hypothetical protein